MKQIISFMLVVLFLLPFVSAATIHGTVYNIDLNPVKNARVDITTQPKQSLIAVNGTYEFQVAPGTYELNASLIKGGSITAFATESLTVATDGEYVLDLIVFPDMGAGLLNTSEDINFNDAVTPEPVAWTKIAIGVAIVAVFVWFVLRSKKEKAVRKHITHHEEHAVSEAKTHEHADSAPATNVVEHAPKQTLTVELQTERDDITPLVDFIRAQGGRTTQKDIRKQFPLSEAKISLLVAELEHKGMIEKIKKGRGNIIILK